MLFLYSNSIFGKVQDRYRVYHSSLHDKLWALSDKASLREVAKEKDEQQNNSAFRIHADRELISYQSRSQVQLQIDTESSLPRHLDFKVTNKGTLYWKSRGLLLFLDHLDTPHTAEKFFYQMISFKYFGSPGPLHRAVVDALFEFLRTLAFLGFIFMVVMSFGDVHQISTTNQLLVTVAGGLVPFLFRHIYTQAGGEFEFDTECIQFQTKFHGAVHSYRQSWEVEDLHIGLNTKTVDSDLSVGTEVRNDAEASVYDVMMPLVNNNTPSGCGDTGHDVDFLPKCSSDTPLVNLNKIPREEEQEERGQTLAHISPSDNLSNVYIIMDG